MNSSGQPIIKIGQLSVVYNQGKPNEARVLDNINLEIYPHEYLILFGPSGCGKSTLLNVISGLLGPSNGTVEVEGRDFQTYSEKEKLEYHRRKIGMVFQSFYLIPTLSVINNVCLPRAFVGDDSPARVQDGLSLLKRFGIDAQAEKFPSDLSGGQRQRVAIARSLINSPQIVVADEPVANLDSKATFNVLSILKELNEVDKKLVILVTHDPAHLSFGDRIIYMQDGKVVKTVNVLEKRAPTIKAQEEYLEDQEKVGREWQAFKEGVLGKAWQLYKKGKLDKEWELVKKDELGKAWSSFKEGKMGKEWALGSEYELIRKEEIGERRREQISPEISTLMRSFKNFTPDQVGMLLIPFKARELFTHAFFHMPEAQLELAQKKFQDFISGVITLDDFEKKLVEKEKKGGAGWDKYHARNLIREVRKIFNQVKKIDYADVSKSAEELFGYFEENFKISLGELERNKLLEYIRMRLNNQITMDEIMALTDRPIVKGGIGLDKRVATKLARELEIIMLARYSM